MSTAGAQAHAFYRDVAAHRRVWTIRDTGGFPAPLTRTGRRARPFWSTRSRAVRIIRQVPAYAQMEPVEFSWEEFRDRLLPDLRQAGMLVGVNWSGASASGYDLEPDWVQHCIELLIEQQNGTRQTRGVETPEDRG